MSQTDLMRNLNAAFENKVFNQQRLILSDNDRQHSDTEEIEADMSFNGSNWFPFRKQSIMAFSDPDCSESNAIPETKVVMFPRTQRLTEPTPSKKRVTFRPLKKNKRRGLLRKVINKKKSKCKCLCALQSRLIDLKRRIVNPVTPQPRRPVRYPSYPENRRLYHPNSDLIV